MGDNNRASRKGHLGTLVVWATLLFAMAAPAAPKVQLITHPHLSEPLVELGSELKEIILTARVDLEGVQFLWSLNGPGRLEGDVTTRRISYILPERLDQETAEVTVSVTVTDNKGESVQERVIFSVHDPHPSPGLGDLEEQLQHLLQTADAYFDRTFYTEPEDHNAFRLYRKALKIDPGNTHARERIRKMAADYKTWAESAQQQGNKTDAARFYERYLLIARYILDELGDQSIRAEYDKIHTRIAEETLPPRDDSRPVDTPTPLPSPRPDDKDIEAASGLEGDADIIQRPGNLYAVIIGTSDYWDEAIPDLPFAENGGRALYEVLTDPRYGGIPPEQVKLVLGAEATNRNIKHAIGTWASQYTTAGDVLIVYYAGHGALEGADSYWVPYDADHKDFYATALNQDAIVAMFARIQAKHLLLLFDAAYLNMAGWASAEPVSLQDRLPWKQLAKTNGLIVTATEGTTPGFDLEEDARSLFSSVLVQGLQGQADSDDDGAIEIQELLDYLQKKVPEGSIDPEAPQVPQIMGQPFLDLPITFDVAKLQQQRDEELQAQQVRLGAIQVKENNMLINPTYFLNPGAEIMIEADLEKPAGRNVSMECVASFGKVTRAQEQTFLYTAPDTPGEIDMVTIKVVDTDTNEIVVQQLLMIQLY